MMNLVSFRKLLHAFRTLRDTESSALFLPTAFLNYLETAPIIYVDIGASGGIHKKWDRLRPHLRTVAFEPDDRAFEALDKNEDDVIYINKALGAKRELGHLNLTRARRCSSIFPPNRTLIENFEDAERFDVTEETEVMLESLDDALSAEGVQVVDFLKIDTQGSGLDILKGAKRILEESVVGVEIEVEFQPLYEDQPLFRDVDAFLDTAGFELFDLRPGYWKRRRGMNKYQEKGQIIFADALYFRRPDPKENVDQESYRSRVIHTAILFLFYGYIDCAYDALIENKAIFEREEIEAVEELMTFYDERAEKESAFRRSGMHNFFTRTADFTDPLKSQFFNISRKLGNIE